MVEKVLRSASKSYLRRIPQCRTIALMAYMSDRVSYLRRIPQCRTIQGHSVHLLSLSYLRRIPQCRTIKTRITIDRALVLPTPHSPVPYNGIEAERNGLNVLPTPHSPVPYNMSVNDFCELVVLPTPHSPVPYNTSSTYQRRRRVLPTPHSPVPYNVGKRKGPPTRAFFPSGFSKKALCAAVCRAFCHFWPKKEIAPHRTWRYGGNSTVGTCPHLVLETPHSPMLSQELSPF